MVTNAPRSPATSVPGLRDRVFLAAAVLLIHVPVGLMRAVYAVLKLLPRRDKVVLMSRLHRRTSADFASLRAELDRQSPGTTVVVLNHRNTNPAAVPWQMLSQMFHLATARGCITDSYMPTISLLRHREPLIIVQTWHALGAIKRFGRAALDSEEGQPSKLADALRMHRGYDWVIAGGPGMVGPFAESFDIPEQRVLPIGTPRIDILCDPSANARKRQKIRDLFPQVGSRPLVLYAPTFRKGAPVEIAPLLDALAGRDVDVAVALHPLDGRDFSTRPGVLQSAEISTMDWLAVADHVVSDYSAIVFDAAVIGTPVYFYLYDLDDYLERRGLFLDVETDLPGPVSRDADVIAAGIAGGAGSREAVAGFRERFVAPADGGCARRIAALVLGREPAELSGRAGEPS